MGHNLWLAKKFNLRKLIVSLKNYNIRRGKAKFIMNARKLIKNHVKNFFATSTSKVFHQN